MNRQTCLNAKLKSRQQGAVAIIVAICLTLFIAMIGLVVDLGHMFVIKTELQNAADSCALAAARELDKAADSLERAENAGRTVGQRNHVDLQNAAVSISPADVTFSVDNTSYASRAGGASINSEYVMCTLRRSGIAMWFMQVVGFGDQAVGAMAVATLQPSQTSCAIPLGICKPETKPTICGDEVSTPDGANMCLGDWYSGKFDPKNGETGSFNWIDFTPPGGGASELSDVLTGTGQCNLAIEDEVGQTGVVASAMDAWNSRFGLYKSGAGNPSLTSAAPDFTGYEYTTSSWTDGRNAYDDFIDRREDRVQYQGVVPPSYTAVNSTQLETYGSNRRLATAPLVDCSGWATSQTVKIEDWACILMLHPISDNNGSVTLEYRGLSNLENSPCATFGVPGGTAGPLVPVLVQ